MEGDTPIEYDNYNDLSIVSARKPINTHLWFELDSGMLYLVDSVDPTKLYYSSDKADNWTQLDIDPSNTSGDGKSRDHIIQSAWHDRTNSTIWFVDCDNDGTADDFDVWKLDYSASETAPTITEVSTSAGADANSVYAYDIFKCGTNIYVVNYETRAAAKKYVAWDVDSAPFVEDSTIGANGPNAYNFGTCDGTTWYGIEDDTTANELFILKFTEASGIGYVGLTGNILNYSAPAKSQMGCAIQGDYIYFIANKDGDGLDYLIRIDTTVPSHTVLGQYNIALMLNRNTEDIEKAFHMSEYKVFQLQANGYQLYLISIVPSDAIFIAITDNFLMNNDGDMFEFVDVLNYVGECVIRYDTMELHTCTFSLHDTYSLAENMLIRIKDTYKGSANQLVFEGYVGSYNTDHDLQYAELISPAIEIDNEFPNGDYSGRTDQIISSLIQDYCNYITTGTLSSGTSVGPVSFYGDKTLREILNDAALVDNKIWYLNPSGQLQYNAGAVDSGIDISNSKTIAYVEREKGPQTINWVKIWGKISAGSQYVGTISSDSADIQKYGRKPYKRTISWLPSNSACTVAASNIRSRFGTQANIISFTHQDSSVGVMLAGETLTFEYSNQKLSVSSAQYKFRTVTYHARRGGTVGYTISDRID